MEKRLKMFLASLFLCVGGVMAQTTVKGTIISADDGEPLPGVSVKVLGEKTGTVTDMNGQFAIEVPNENTRLEFTHIGMLRRVVKARNGMQIALDTDDQLLDEVMVIAYGTTKRSTFTGSAVEIKSEDITNHVASSPTNALIGKVAGVQAVGVSEGPGGTPTIRIRGIGSLSASSAPLYIIDGSPMEASSATLNPNDIESMSVLKGASATALYGARGANGVILITTKKARGQQDAEVTFDAKWGSNSRLVPQYDVISDPAEYYETQFRSLYNSKYYHGSTPDEAYAYANSQLFKSDGGGLGYQVYTIPEGENLIGRNFRLNPHATLGYSDGEYTYLPDNWYDETYHNSFRQEYSASVKGNTGKLSYFGSVGYLNDGGYVNNSSFERYTARTNVEYQAKKWLRLTTNMSFAHTDAQDPSYDTDTWASSGNLFYITNTMGPIYPLYVRDAEGNIVTENGITIYDNNTNTNFKRPNIVGNAVRDNEYNSTKGYTDYFTGNWQAMVTPVEWLDLSADLTANAINSRVSLLGSPFSNASSVDGYAQVGHDRVFSVQQRYGGNFHQTFANKHNVALFAAYEQYKYKSQSLTGYNDHLFLPDVAELNNAFGNEQKSVSSSTDNYMNEGFLARFTYDYDERYFLDGSIRRDGSSRFAPDHRWGTFGGVSAGWQINKEKFLVSKDWINLLKLRASWGYTGNDQGFGNFAWSPRYSVGYNKDNGTYYSTLSSMGNEDLTWEKKRQWEVGVDFSFFKYRLNGTIEFYSGTTTDLIYDRPLPASNGLITAQIMNVGSLLNRGLEIALDGTPIKTRNMEWNLNLALLTNHNEVLGMHPDVEEDGIITTSRILRVGGSFQQAYMIKYAGVDSETGEAMYYTDELDAAGNKTGNIITTKDLSAATKYDCGDIMPKWVGGFGTTFKAYGFDLSAQFSFQLGGKFYDGQYQALMNNGITSSAGQAMHRDLLDAWSETNKGSDIPRMSTAAADDPGVGSQTPMDRFLTSSNYLSLNNLQIGYTFPKSWMSKIQVKNLRVYVAGENLFLLTARKGMDPRFNFGIGSMTTGGGLASGNYSTMRTVAAGLSVTF